MIVVPSTNRATLPTQSFNFCSLEGSFVLPVHLTDPYVSDGKNPKQNPEKICLMLVEFRVADIGSSAR